MTSQTYHVNIKPLIVSL